jgi:hypothetical protein
LHELCFVDLVRESHPEVKTSPRHKRQRDARHELLNGVDHRVPAELECSTDPPEMLGPAGRGDELKRGVLERSRDEQVVEQPCRA